MAKVLTQRTVEFRAEEILELLQKEALKALDLEGIEVDASDWKVSWAGSPSGGFKVTLAERDERGQ